MKGDYTFDQAQREWEEPEDETAEEELEHEED